MKKIISLILVAVLIFTSFSLSVFAADSVFSDISDTSTARDVEVLRLMGVIGGMEDGKFHPEQTLTRAQFCKMAVILMGKEKNAETYKTFTIFPDVKASHWAAKYINYAVRGDTKFIAGFPDGTFGPERNITFAEAATILVRMLGYSDADTGIVWPDGYISTAKTTGISDGVSLNASSQISRKDAVKLFVNMLDAQIKDSGAYYSSVASASQIDNVIITSVDAVADDGTGDAIETNVGIYKTNGIKANNILCGTKGRLLLNENGYVLTVVPSKGTDIKNITVSSVKSASIIDENNVEYKFSSDTDVYYYGEKMTYSEAFKRIAPGQQLVISYSNSGKAEYIYIGKTASKEAVVLSADKSVREISTIAGSTNYKLIKNGVEVDASALRKGDVAVYDASTNSVRICTNRIYGVYESVYPNTELPSKITTMGITLDVLPSAAASLSSHKINEVLTFYLTEDNKVAGVEKGSAGGGNECMGIVRSISDKTAVVDLFCGLSVYGDTGIAYSSLSSYNGQIVTVTSSKKGALTLKKVSGKDVNGDFDVKNAMVGSTKLAKNARIYEKIGPSAVMSISLNDISVEKIEQMYIYYVHKAYDGLIDVLVIRNATGENYKYGRFYVETEYGAPVLTVTNSTGSTSGIMCNSSLSTGMFGGVVVSAANSSSGTIMTLKKLSNVNNSSWNNDSEVTVGGITYPISDNVECYNAVTDEWISLNAARAFADTMNLYYDKEPSAGGKIRVIEIPKT